MSVSTGVSFTRLSLLLILLLILRWPEFEAVLKKRQIVTAGHAFREQVTGVIEAFSVSDVSLEKDVDFNPEVCCTCTVMSHCDAWNQSKASA